MKTGYSGDSSSAGAARQGDYVSGCFELRQCGAGGVAAGDWAVHWRAFSADRDHPAALCQHHKLIPTPNTASPELCRKAPAIRIPAEDRKRCEAVIESQRFVRDGVKGGNGVSCTCHPLTSPAFPARLSAHRSRCYRLASAGRAARTVGRHGRWDRARSGGAAFRDPWGCPRAIAR